MMMVDKITLNIITEDLLYENISISAGSASRNSNVVFNYSDKPPLPGLDDDLVKGLRKGSGIKYSRSAALVSLFSGQVIKNALAGINIAGQNINVYLASNSSTANVCFKFEKDGAEYGWHTIDPFAFPNTIPSAIGTNILMMLGKKGEAITFNAGADSLLHAFCAAYLRLNEFPNELSLVLAADELCDAQIISKKGLNLEMQNVQGAIVFIVFNPLVYNFPKARKIVIECESVLESVRYANSLRISNSQTLMRPLELAFELRRLLSGDKTVIEGFKHQL